MTTIRIRNTEDAVAVIAALATKAIAKGGHEGHDLETVGERMTSDAILGRIRAAYDRHTGNGLTPKDAVIAVGQTLVATYCNSAGIPAHTPDPAGVLHRPTGRCAATWRQEPVNRNRPELGTTSQSGHPECGEPGAVDRFVKAAHGDYYRPVYACPAHTRS